MHVVEASKISGLGEEIRRRSILSMSKVKFSDFESRNLILAIKKEDGRFDTHSSSHLPDACYRFLENQKKYFDEMFNKNNSACILYGYSIENSRVKFTPIYDLTNKHVLTTFFNTPLVSRFKSQDKILCLIDDSLGFIVSDFENIPLLALFRHVSRDFLKPAANWDGTEEGVKLVLAVLALQYGTKSPTINTSLKDILIPSAEFDVSDEAIDKFVAKFYDELVVTAPVKEEKKTEEACANPQFDFTNVPKRDSILLSEFSIIKCHKEEYIKFLVEDGVNNFIIDYPALTADYYECSLSKAGWLIFHTKNPQLVKGESYSINTSRLKRLVGWERISILTDNENDYFGTDIIM